MGVDCSLAKVGKQLGVQYCGWDGSNLCSSADTFNLVRGIGRSNSLGVIIKRTPPKSLSVRSLRICMDLVRHPSEGLNNVASSKDLAGYSLRTVRAVGIELHSSLMLQSPSDLLVTARALSVGRPTSRSKCRMISVCISWIARQRCIMNESLVFLGQQYASCLVCSSGKRT